MDTKRRAEEEIILLNPISKSPRLSSTSLTNTSSSLPLIDDANELSKRLRARLYASSPIQKTKPLTVQSTFYIASTYYNDNSTIP
jgi:hypothetical protein